MIFAEKLKKKKIIQNVLYFEKANFIYSGQSLLFYFHFDFTYDTETVFCGFPMDTVLYMQLSRNWDFLIFLSGDFPLPKKRGIL